jgi:hypothetical protein
VSEDWKELGFQGRDPATDFRGMGILGLSQLVSYGERAEGKRVFCALLGSSPNFPFSIAGINITSSIFGLRRPTLFKLYYLHLGSSSTEAGGEDFLQVLYSKVFGLFLEHWNQSEQNFMQFNRILAQVLDTL